MKRLDMTVTNPTDSAALRPVTGGVPIAEGVAPEGSVFILSDSDGTQVPCQATVIAKWKDGSARWVLLDFQAQPKAGAVGRYVLTWDGGDAVGPQSPVVAQAGDGFALQSGEISIGPADDGTIEVSGKARIRFCATGPDGAEYQAKVESANIELAGEMRSMLALAGSFVGEDGERLFGFRMWISVFAGLSKVLVEPMVLMDAEKGVVQRFREVRLEVVSHEPGDGSIGGWGGLSDKHVRLFQVDDRNYRVEGAEGSGDRAPGWARIGGVAVAVRDFWQQWPKALAVEPGKLTVGLLPRFEAGTFDHMFEPWYKHDYLFDGDCYRLRTGQARRWQVWLDFDGEGATLGSEANAPLVPAADPRQAIQTGVWGQLLPEGDSPDFDEWAAAQFESYVRAIDNEGDYGAMNWGDLFGERICNWANNEYDTGRQIAVQFARTGDPRYLYRAMTIARHTSEVDVIHYVSDDLRSYFLDEVCKAYTNRSIIDNCPIRPGMMHAHCVGHMGGFHPVDDIRKLFISFAHGAATDGNPYLCLDPYNVGHVFSQGMAYVYFLTGDPWIRETLGRVGNNLASLVEDRKMPFTGRPCAGRELGWPMLSLGAIYELDFDDRYLNAMRILAEDALEEQDPNCGGWLQQLFGGHCNCVKRKHTGEATFITSIRLNGMCRYYRLSGDERIPDSLKKAIDNLLQDTWSDHKAGWRYTSCPASWHHGQPGVTMMAMANSVDLLGDPEHRRVLQAAWDALFSKTREAVLRGGGAGRSLGSSTYGCAEAVCALAARKEEAVL